MLRGVRVRVDIQRSALEVVADAVAQVAVYGSFLFVGYRTVMGNLTLGDLVMFYQAFQKGQGFLQSFLNNLAGLYEHNLFISNLYEFLDIPRKVTDPEQPVPPPQPLTEGIEFRNVGFRYPASERSVLEDVNLTIRPGEVVALVGENGSGKTTLVKLLCRLYDPDSGSITLDGVDLRSFMTNVLRREISVIFQDYAHYNLSAAENIGFGNVELSDNLEAIVAAAKHADAHDAIMSLPQGYDTMLGKLLDNGEELSIGQWQKIALARAFLRGSQVIVLDEPTSAMDPKAEAGVFEKFRELLDGRTAILISHRLSTVRMADRIYVLQEGRVIESGTHDELVYRNGTYANLFESQARHYRQERAT
jgi:ATP-binding cassette subfamily B protein